MRDGADTRTRNFWGWGHHERALSDEHRGRLAMLLSTQMEMSALQPLAAPKLAAISLPSCRIRPPAALAELCSDTPIERAGHCYGKAYRDVIRGLRGDFSAAPDLVALPNNASEVGALMEWCEQHAYALIPYGGGSSVVGGTEARCRDDYTGVVSLDMRNIGGVAEIDTTSRCARILAGSYGPRLEAELKPHGLTLRHYPQSFEFSTLGGWLATRAGGHFATLYTHIDDMLQSLCAITPRGRYETRRLPANGAGPDANRLMLGSEGALGIIVEAWMRLQERPRYKRSMSMRFDDFYRAADCARQLAQSGLFPSNCRLLDANEALINGVGNGSDHFLLVGFESADHPLDAWMNRARAICQAAGGEEVKKTKGALASAALVDGDEEDAAARWRKMFLRAPYLRDGVAQLGAISETFETAVIWSSFEEFHRKVIRETQRVLDEVCGGGLVSSRVTHVYPDGAAPYFTVIAPAKPGCQLEQWDAIKAAVSETLHQAGGTITHHHAVGRDHRPWYDKEVPAPFRSVLAAAKRDLDPGGILNPGVLVDTQTPARDDIAAT